MIGTNNDIDLCIDCGVMIPFEDLYCEPCKVKHPDAECNCPNRCKPIRKEYYKKYYEKNKESFKEYFRDYYLKKKKKHD